MAESAYDGIRTNVESTISVSDQNRKRTAAVIKGAGPLDAIHALRESEERFHAIFQNAGIGIALGNLQGETIATNPALQKMLGYTAEELLSMPLPMADAQDTAEDLRLMQEVVARVRDYYQLEKKYIRHDGGILWGRLTVSMIFSPDGAPCYAVGMVEDITAQKLAAEALARSEEQLRQSQKMEAIGRLAGGVAHDFNNLLTAILGHTHLLLSALPDGEERVDADAIRLAAERAAGLTRQLLAFSRKQAMQPLTLDLNEVVRSIEPMLLRLIGEDVRFATALAPEPCWVMADPTQLEQIIVNLTVNARDALQIGGQLEIATGIVERRDDGEDGNATAGRYAVLSVRDTGCGILPANLPNIFEPFFTTKPAGQGTGLGLPTVYGIVRQSDGFVEVDSTMDVGTTMRVHLPLAPAPAPGNDRTDAPVAESGSRGGETLLLVEDEDSVRGLATRILQAKGYRVLEANGGSAAIELLDGFAEPIDLLIADVIMPDLTGPNLAAIVRQRRPGIRTLFISGYTQDVMTQRGELAAHEQLLEKPFTPSQLARRVRDVLDEA
jgi:PAS domain S-box-containing protein